MYFLTFLVQEINICKLLSLTLCANCGSGMTVQGARATDITLDTLCALMTESSVTDVVQRYANVNSLLLNAYDLKCLDFKYDKMVSDLSKTGWDESAAEGGLY